MAASRVAHAWEVEAPVWERGSDSGSDVSDEDGDALWYDQMTPEGAGNELAGYLQKRRGRFEHKVLHPRLLGSASWGSRAASPEVELPP